uniref:POU domain, class 4, transcription factor 3 n=1 Tax=Euleptes europaea TaxID=460621 RepID=UPI002541799F|nr:POU domain, class 4, transcription factor 3 [Euleptes europaea]
MMGMSAKPPFGMHPALQEAKYPALHAGSEAMRRVCLPAPQLQGNIFGGFDESLLARAEALAAADLAAHGKSHHPHHPFKPDATYHTMSSVACPAAPSPAAHPHPHPGVAHLDGDLLEHLSPALLGGPEPGAVLAAQLHPHAPHPHLGAAMGHLHPALGGLGHPPPVQAAAAAAPHGGLACLGDAASDPRELEAFAERFKQRRIKLGVTQADVGAALAELKIPGVGSLSQSTICRFESLTLSHNNMTALQPVLHAWLEEAEAACRERGAKAELFDGAAGGGGAERKRKRTSIAAPEKRSLEAYFALQPRPSSDKIAAIAEKLDLKKNVVRVWFCNQRQKQKRMKYAAGH